MSEASTKSQAVTTQEQAQPDKLELQLLEQAKTPQERAAAFQMAAAVRQSKMIRVVATAIAETGWGKGVSTNARAMVVRYCLEIGADPVRHVHILGGSIYLNAYFWMDLVAANPMFERSATEFIHDDERADTMERQRRKVARVTYGVPEKATGAAVVTLYYKGDRGPFIGVNWAGVSDKDPVGKAEPTKTAESRAYRRAALKAEPAWFAGHPRLKAAESVIAQGRDGPQDGDPGVLSDVGQVAGEQPAIAALASGGEPVAGAAPQMARHNPSAVCEREGEHPYADCGFYDGKA